MKTLTIINDGPEMNEKIFEETQILCEEANVKLNYLQDCRDKLKSFEKKHIQELKEIDPENTRSFFYAAYEDYRQKIECAKNELEYNLEFLGYKKQDSE